MEEREEEEGCEETSIQDSVKWLNEYIVSMGAKQGSMRL